VSAQFFCSDVVKPGLPAVWHFGVDGFLAVIFSCKRASCFYCSEYPVKVVFTSHLFESARGKEIYSRSAGIVPPAHPITNGRLRINDVCTADTCVAKVAGRVSSRVYRLSSTMIGGARSKKNARHVLSPLPPPLEACKRANRSRIKSGKGFARFSAICAKQVTTQIGKRLLKDRESSLVKDPQGF
jgi:hypothetical protein